MKAEPAYASPCGSAVKLSCSLCYPAVTLGPIKAVSGVGACFATLDNQEGAIAVMLDFMNPACTRRRVIDCGCELRLDEVQRHATDLAEGQEIASRLPGSFDPRFAEGQELLPNVQPFRLAYWLNILN